MKIFKNGTILTLDKQWSVQQAIVFDGDTIVATGSNDDLLRRYPKAEVTDLQGCTVLPAFYDAHLHLYGIGLRLRRTDLTGITSIEANRTVLQSKLTSDASQWILARGWDQNLWPSKELPTARDLDLLTTSQPVVLTRIDGHAIWCNSYALKHAGVTSASKDPEGGLIVRDVHGEPTGVLLDEAMKLVQDHIPAMSTAELEEYYEEACQHLLGRGVVGAHDMGVTRAQWEALKSLYAKKGDSLPRSYIFIDTNQHGGPQFFAERLAAEQFSDSPHERLRLVGIKIYLDGALGSRGAELFEDYSDDPGNRGLRLSSDEDIVRWMQLANGRGLQIAIHAIGDAANSRALDLIARADARDAVLYRIEHAQIVQQNDLSRFATLGVRAVVQPQFYASDRHWSVERLGEERMKNAYRWKSLLDAGIRVVATSDAPIEQSDPLLAIRLLLGRDGVEDGEALTIQEALRSHITEALALSGEEHLAGTLEAGKRADLVILEPTDLADKDFTSKVKVLATLIGGEVLYAGAAGFRL